MPDALRVVLLSDTHLHHDALQVPAGDILIHAGDSTRRGTLAELDAVDTFFAGLSHPHKLIIAGNHDFAFERQPTLARARIEHATYLEDDALTLEGVRFYGSPWQPVFFNWAFNLPRGDPLRRVWARIPDETDVLITHGPPHGHLDRTSTGIRAGCEALLEAIARVRPCLHVFGDIHEAYGVHQGAHTLFANASICDLRYRPRNPPLVVDLLPPAHPGASWTCQRLQP